MALNPIERLVLAAECFEGFTEIPKGSNAGQVVESFLREVGLGPGHPWCAAAVARCGTLALGDRWPVPKSGLVQDVVNWARQRDCLEPEPLVGDLMVLWYPKLKRYGHIGVVTKVKPGVVECLEGNTNEASSREGFGMFRRTRAVTDRMRFVRWVRALPLPQ